MVSKLEEVNQSSKKDKEATDISQSELKNLAAFCFDTLIAQLNDKEKKGAKYTLSQVECTLFVTWTKGKKSELRGCIGTFQPDQLENNLAEYTVLAALDDDRFKPVKLKEMPDLQVGLSLLVNFAKEPLKDPFDWVVGKHGVSMQLKHAGKEYESTFLPEVAEEEGWDQEETLFHLLDKDDFDFEKVPFETVLPKIKITTYESIKVKLSFQEYVAMREAKHE